MIPGRNNTRYKYLTRVKLDLWHTLKTKQLRKKKWRPLKGRIKRQRPLPPLIGYDVKTLPKFPVYCRFYYKNTLDLKQGIKLFFGGLQDYRIKALVLRGKKPGLSQLHMLRIFEDKLTSFLYSLKIAKTISEATSYIAKKLVFLNGLSSKSSIRIGDTIHFAAPIEDIVRRRLMKKPNKFLPFEMDFDTQSLRFYLMKKKTYFWHPFIHKFKRVIHWYII